jgi:hypothetical protein
VAAAVVFTGTGREAEGAPKGALTDLADPLDQIGQAADLSPRPRPEREGVGEGDERVVLFSRRGADSSLAGREAGHRSTLLLMVRIGELENGDLYVPVPAEHGAQGHVVDGIMCRVASGTDEHAGWLRGVDAGRVELVRRDPTRKFAWLDGPS